MHVRFDHRAIPHMYQPGRLTTESVCLQIVINMRENDINNDNECAYRTSPQVPLLTKYGVLHPNPATYAGKIQSVTDAGIAPNHATRIVLQMWSMLPALCQFNLRRRGKPIPRGTFRT
jgi:hypothetical protein